MKDNLMDHFRTCALQVTTVDSEKYPGLRTGLMPDLKTRMARTI
jgi:hypothetical protein